MFRVSKIDCTRARMCKHINLNSRELLISARMVTIKRDLTCWFPKCMSELIFEYLLPLENALASVARSGREFRHIYWFGGDMISAISFISHRVVDDEPAGITRDRFDAMLRPHESEMSDTYWAGTYWGIVLPNIIGIYSDVKNRGISDGTYQSSSLSYKIAVATDLLLGNVTSKSKRRRTRRKKLHALRHAE